MRIAVLVKQVPVAEELRLEGGRAVRAGVPLEVNAYCRRANAKAVELAGDDGEVVVVTMGPSSAEDCLREMIACGATSAIHLCDPAFAGADTLATSRALAAALHREGPFDLVLCGLNSIDADTGQVGPQVAELLGMPFAPGVRELHVTEGRIRAVLEADDGYRTVEGKFPAVLSTAERLCEPSKAPQELRDAVAPALVRRLSAADLGLASWETGVSGSPTSVGPVRVLGVTRRPRLTADVREAVHLLEQAGGLGLPGPVERTPVPATGGTGRQVWCVLDPSSELPAADLIGEAAALAAAGDGAVTVIVAAPPPTGLETLGADRVLVVANGREPEQLADVVAAASAAAAPWALLIEGTRTGRVIASTVAARNGWGLTGDAIAFEVSARDRLVCWKPAFGGRLVVPIESSSPVQMATVRPGVLPSRLPRTADAPEVRFLVAPSAPRFVTTDITRTDDGVDILLHASTVIGVGAGVNVAHHPMLLPLQRALGGAPLAATRKVTDRGLMPRSRQVGVTGQAISPHLYVAIGISGKFNHMVGVENATVVFAINVDPAAPVFSQCDVGLIAPWQDVVQELAAEIESRRALAV